jgi:hypothetical protein
MQPNNVGVRLYCGNESNVSDSRATLIKTATESSDILKYLRYGDDVTLAAVVSR